MKCGTWWLTSRREGPVISKDLYKFSRTSSSRKFCDHDMVAAFKHNYWRTHIERIVKIPWGRSVLAASQLTCAFACHYPDPSSSIITALVGWWHTYFKGILALQRVIEETPQRAEGTAGQALGQASGQGSWQLLPAAEIRARPTLGGMQV